MNLICVKYCDELEETHTLLLPISLGSMREVLRILKTYGVVHLNLASVSREEYAALEETIL